TVRPWTFDFYDGERRERLRAQEKLTQGRGASMGSNQSNSGSPPAAIGSLSRRGFLGDVGTSTAGSRKHKPILAPCTRRRQRGRNRARAEARDVGVSPSKSAKAVRRRMKAGQASHICLLTTVVLGGRGLTKPSGLLR